MTYRKKLIEVALPLAEINDASAHDKMPGIGAHPKSMHYWWARLPLPAARAFLFASLVDDPSSDPEYARKTEVEIEARRDELHDMLRQLVSKEASRSEETWSEAIAEIKRCCGGDMPEVLDPFCGGGSIPYQALQLGLTAHGSDLNPVAVLITKALIEIPSKFVGKSPVNPDSTSRIGHSAAWKGIAGLAEDVRYYGAWIHEEAERRIGHLFPKVNLPKENGGGKATVIAWLWARTVACPNPACCAQMPLVRSFALSTKKGKKVSIEPRIDKRAKSIRFEVHTEAKKPTEGTVERSGAHCLLCQSPVPFDHIRTEGKAGRISSRLLAIVAEGPRGRIYVSPNDIHESIVEQIPNSEILETELPKKALGFRVQLYGMTKHKDLFTRRQLLSLSTFSALVSEVRERVLRDARKAGFGDDERGISSGGSGARAYADSVATYLAFAVDRLADFNCGLSTWKPSGEQQMHLFVRQAMPMVWDFAEANVFAEKAICWTNCVKITCESLNTMTFHEKVIGNVRQLDATQSLDGLKSVLVSTDPPYYGNIGYADLSDFFYVWLRRSVGAIYSDLMSTLLTPKSEELVATPHRFDESIVKAAEHFEDGFRRAFGKIREKLDTRFPMTIYYAMKQEETSEDVDGTEDVAASTGWETLLTALVDTGFQITATWPVRASQKWRMVAVGTNALASYVVLACRPRAIDAPMATRREFASELRSGLPPALKNLQHGNIAPVDLAQAIIGPGMAIFSRYSKVIEADGSRMSVRTALQIINQELDTFFAAQEGDLDADTRFCLAWFEQRSMDEAPFGEADVLARAKNTSVQGLVEAGVLHSKAGKVRILRRDEYRDDWDPVADKRLTVWECSQHLIRRLQRSESDAAQLVKRLGAGRSEDARALAYRLFSICERKKWPQEALAYNGLVIAWPEILKLAGKIEVRPDDLRLNV